MQYLFNGYLRGISGMPGSGATLRSPGGERVQNLGAKGTAFESWSQQFTKSVTLGSLYPSMGLGFFIYQFSSVAQLGPTLCDPMDCSTPGLPVHHQLLELAQTQVHLSG